jgi:capsular polysaccharide transport system permease protein
VSAAFSQALAVQGRVIWALSLRELQGMHGETRLGYLWQIIKVGFGIAVFWGIRAVLGFHMSVGLPLPVYLLTGFIPWYIFSALFKHCMEAKRTNHSLLNFPQITLLDIQMGSGILAVFTHAAILLLFLVLFRFLDIPWEVRNPAGLLYSFFALAAFGFGAGLVLATLNSFFPLVEKLVPMAMRILFFVSGVFWPIGQFARTGMLEIFLWNPMLNYIELLRASFLYPDLPLAPDPQFFFFLSASVLTFGLFCERFFRRRVLAL